VLRKHETRGVPGLGVEGARLAVAKELQVRGQVQPHSDRVSLKLLDEFLRKGDLRLLRLRHASIIARAVLEGQPCQNHESAPYSHSIVAGGFDEMSYTTRFTPGASLMIRLEIRASTSNGIRAQSAVMKSWVSTARTAITCS